MRKRTGYRSLLFASAAILVVGLVAFFALGPTINWVGHTDIEVRFVITDAETGQPIPNAMVHICAEAGAFCDDPQQLEFTITADKDGHASQLATNCMCFGSKGTFKDTFASRLPKWSFHATATGYSAAEPAYLDVAKNARQVQRGDPFATLSVPIRMQKTPHNNPSYTEPRAARGLKSMSRLHR